MNIIIDPYMFEIEDENEIRDNISFFHVLIYLCTIGRINVFLYKELIEKMLARDVKPFPIYIGQVKDGDLRCKIQILNKAFVSTIMNNIKSLDLEECGGEQDFEVNGPQSDVNEFIKGDEKYYELLSILLHSCYNRTSDLSQCILTGRILKGRNIGDRFILTCKCLHNKFEKEYRFGSIEEFEKVEDRAYLKLNQTVLEQRFSFVPSPVIVRGDHHNKLQNNSDFTTFEGLSRTNKSVLLLLRKFGLSKIVFGEFHVDSSRAKGTIITYDVQFTDDNEIVKGWLFAETGYKHHIDMYFPKGVGNNLRLVLDNEFDKNSVERLVDSLL